MTIQVELSPETEAWLAAKAASHRMDVAAYATRLLERARLPSPNQPNTGKAAPRRLRSTDRKSLAQLFAESPFSGLNLDFEKDRGIGRDTTL